jgi:hypothetical protein
MKYLNYARDPDGVFDFMQEQEDGSVLAKDTFNSVIKVGYRADNLEMVWLKGHHLERLFAPRPPPEEE